MPFNIGDKVVYPHHGAATVEKREKRKIEIDGKSKNVEYLVMRVAYTDLVVRVPTERIEEIGIRDVINTEEVEEVFAVIMKTDARTPSNWSRRFKNHIEKLKSGDIYQVAEVVRNLSSRDGDKGLSAGEKRMLSQARNILTSELSYALDLDREQAEDTLNKVLRKEDVSDVIALKKKNARAAKKAKAEKKKAAEAKAAAKAPAKKAATKVPAKTAAKKPAAKKAASKTTATKATAKKTTAKKK
ncbi:MAG: CarD family transcriptional regulator [Acidimicrobiia bacterium]